MAVVEDVFDIAVVVGAVVAGIGVVVVVVNEVEINAAVRVVAGKLLPLRHS